MIYKFVYFHFVGLFSTIVILLENHPPARETVSSPIFSLSISHFLPSWVAFLFDFPPTSCNYAYVTESSPTGRD